MVGGFKGTKSGEARKALIAALENDGGYDVSETSAVKPGDRDKQFASASGNASALLVGTVKKSGLVVSVHNGADGALVHDVEIDGATPAKLDKNIADSAGLSLAEAIAKTKSGTETSDGDAVVAPSDDERQPETSTKSAADEGAQSPRAAGAAHYPDAHSPLELEAGLRAVHRDFAYNDTPRGSTAPLTYKLPLGPALFINGTFYPIAFTTRGFAGNFGITAGYEANIATKSTYKTADTNDPNRTSEHDLDTTAHQYFVGLKARIPISVQELGLVAAYGQQTFRLNGDEASPIVPDLLYKFVRVAVEGRFRFDALTLGLHVGTRFVSSTGGLERDFFPGHVKTQDIEAGIAAGYSLTSSLDLIAGLDVTRYAFDFKPVPSNATVVAGGATDTYASGFLGLRYSLPSHD